MRISIIIPALNEESRIAETVRSLRAQDPYEILVVDGGSSDATRQQAQEADQVLDGPCGRALQMNQGAALASGDALLFLHADYRLDAGALAVASRLLGSRGVAAGCFRMCVDASGLVFRMIDF